MKKLIVLLTLLSLEGMANESRGEYQEINKEKVKTRRVYFEETPLERCARLQYSGLLEDHEYCYEILDNGGILEQDEKFRRRK